MQFEYTIFLSLGFDHNYGFNIWLGFIEIRKRELPSDSVFLISTKKYPVS